MELWSLCTRQPSFQVPKVNLVFSPVLDMVETYEYEKTGVPKLWCALESPDKKILMKISKMSNSINSIQLIVFWTRRWWWGWRHPVWSAATVGAWTWVQIPILIWITIASTMTIGWRSIVVRRTIGCSIKCRFPVFTCWSTHFRTAFCKDKHLLYIRGKKTWFNGNYNKNQAEWNQVCVNCKVKFMVKIYRKQHKWKLSIEYLPHCPTSWLQQLLGCHVHWVDAVI